MRGRIPRLARLVCECIEVFPCLTSWDFVEGEPIVWLAPSPVRSRLHALAPPGLSPFLFPQLRPSSVLEERS